MNVYKCMYFKLNSTYHIKFYAMCLQVIKIFFLIHHIMTLLFQNKFYLRTLISSSLSFYSVISPFLLLFFYLQKKNSQPFIIWGQEENYL